MIDPLWLLLIGMIVVIGGILVLRLHAFLALILGALVVGSATTETALHDFAVQKGMAEFEAQQFARSSVGERMGDEFGRTCAKIGILIAMASIIGKCMLESGAAERIVRSALVLFGTRGVPYAFLTSGFILGMPVFFDTVFYLTLPLGKAMAVRSRRNYGLYIMCIVAGATMTHSLVPPTPGPLFVAGELSVNIGLMILGGLVVGVFTVSAGFLYALWANRRWTIPLRDSADFSAEEMERFAGRTESDLPALWLSLLPLLLPVLFIAGRTVLGPVLPDPAHGVSVLSWIVNYLGNPNIALTLSAAIALITLVLSQRSAIPQMVKTVQTALTSGGVIILITAAGGAFGGLLQQTNVGARIQDMTELYHIAVLPLAFFVTALVRTAQGSATVAMITSVGILGGLAGTGQLGFHPLYLALVIGCGSKPIPWMNDSGFWVICKMSGMTEGETLKTSSAMMTLMGFSGLIVVLILARLFPLV